jgi:hypothetical protein
MNVAKERMDENPIISCEWPVVGKGTDVDPEHLAIDLHGNI